jgi:hypothetical protein
VIAWLALANRMPNIRNIELSFWVPEIRSRDMHRHPDDSTKQTPWILGKPGKLESYSCKLHSPTTGCSLHPLESASVRQIS